MPREKESYREQLVRVNEFFGDKQVLNIKDVITFTGLCRNTVKKHFVFNKMKVITPCELARQLLA